MRRRDVNLSPEAVTDLRQLRQWIAARAGDPVAERFISRIERFCAGFSLASQRGHQRDDIRPGLRIAGFERRTAIVFSVDHDVVTILRVFHGGQDWEAALRGDDAP